MSLSFHNLNQYVSCYYDNCVPPEERARAVRTSRKDYVEALTKVSLLRFPLSSSKPLSSLKPPFSYTPFSDICISMKRAYMEVAKRYHISARRLSYFSRFSNVFYPTTFTYTTKTGKITKRKSYIANGKLMELIFYTRYKRLKSKSMNEVFAFRLWTPVPLNFSCADSIIAFYSNAGFNHYVKSLLLKLLSFSIFIVVGRAELNFENNNPCVFRLPEWVKLYGASSHGSPMTKAMRDVVSYGLGKVSIEEDIEMLKEAMPETFTSVYSRDIISDFVRQFPTSDVRVGCRELNAQLFDLAKGIPQKLTNALQLSWLNDNCSTAVDMLSFNYCKMMPSVYVLPNPDHYYLMIKSTGNISYGKMEERPSPAIIVMPLYTWANGVIKYPLEAPSIGFVERMRFSNTDIYAFFEEIPHFIAREKPKDVIKHIYNATISYLVPPEKYSRASEHFKNEYFESVIVPLNFYNLANYLWIGGRATK